MKPLGIGTDIIEIERVAAAIRRHEGILDRLFSPAEQEDYRSRGSRIEVLAGKFAAKEAVVKALGTGVRGFSWNQVEIVPDALGKPCCRLLGAAGTVAGALKVGEILVTISHNRTQAVAYALITQTEDTDETGNQ